MLTRFFSFEKTSLIIFSVFFVHITLLDLCLIDKRGLILLWQDSFHWLTITVHLAISIIATGCYVISQRCYVKLAGRAHS